MTSALVMPRSVTGGPGCQSDWTGGKEEEEDKKPVGRRMPRRKKEGCKAPRSRQTAPSSTKSSARGRRVWKGSTGDGCRHRLPHVTCVNVCYRTLSGRLCARRLPAILPSSRARARAAKWAREEGEGVEKQNSRVCGGGSGRCSCTAGL